MIFQLALDFMNAVWTALLTFQKVSMAIHEKISKKDDDSDDSKKDEDSDDSDGSDGCCSPDAKKPCRYNI